MPPKAWGELSSALALPDVAEFGERLTVTRPSDVLRRCTILDGQHTLGNHLTSVGTNDVNTQDPISLLIGDEFDHSFGVQVGLGPGICGEGESSDVVLLAGSFDLLLGLANPSGLGVSVHHTRDGSIVDVAISLGNVLDSGDTLLLSLVRQHSTECGVTDGTDVGNLGAVLLVNDDTAPLVNLNSDVLETETGGVRATTNSNKNNIGIKLRGNQLSWVDRKSARDLRFPPFRP